MLNKSLAALCLFAFGSGALCFIASPSLARDFDSSGFDKLDPNGRIQFVRSLLEERDLLLQNMAFEVVERTMNTEGPEPALVLESTFRLRRDGIRVAMHGRHVGSKGNLENEYDTSWDGKFQRSVSYFGPDRVPTGTIQDRESPLILRVWFNHLLGYRVRSARSAEGGKIVHFPRTLAEWFSEAVATRPGNITVFVNEIEGHRFITIKDVRGKNTEMFYLDPEHGNMPVRFSHEYRAGERMVGSETHEVTAKKQVNGVWLPTEIIRRVKGEGGKVLEELVCTASSFELGNVTDSDLKVEFKAGTKVVDLRDKTAFEVGQDGSRTSIPLFDPVTGKVTVGGKEVGENASAVKAAAPIAGHGSTENVDLPSSGKNPATPLATGDHRGWIYIAVVLGVVIPLAVFFWIRRRRGALRRALILGISLVLTTGVAGAEKPDTRPAGATVLADVLNQIERARTGIGKASYKFEVQVVNEGADPRLPVRSSCVEEVLQVDEYRRTQVRKTSVFKNGASNISTTRSLITPEFGAFAIADSATAMQFPRDAKSGRFSDKATNMLRMSTGEDPIALAFGSRSLKDLVAANVGTWSAEVRGQKGVGAEVVIEHRRDGQLSGEYHVDPEQGYLVTRASAYAKHPELSWEITVTPERTGTQQYFPKTIVVKRYKQGKLGQTEEFKISDVKLDASLHEEDFQLVALGLAEGALMVVEQPTGTQAVMVYRSGRLIRQGP
jgi:hypothetical protein